MKTSETLILLLTIFVMAGLFAVTQVGAMLCRQSFSGVWSSIVIDDCYGSFWSPTGHHKLVTDEPHRYEAVTEQVR